MTEQSEPQKYRARQRRRDPFRLFIPFYAEMQATEHSGVTTKIVKCILVITVCNQYREHKHQKRN